MPNALNTDFGFAPDEKRSHRKSNGLPRGGIRRRSTLGRILTKRSVSLPTQ